jgi:VWFA-related protein
MRLTAWAGAALVIAAASNPGATPGSQDRQVIRSRADLVTADVTVRNDRGQFVPDLRQDEFDIFEDGVRQSIVSFSLTHGGRTLNLHGAAAPPAVEGIVVPPPRPTTDASGRVFVIFVDDLHMEPRLTSRVKHLLGTIRNELLHEGDLFTIVSSGPSSIEVQPTYDLRRMDEAIRKIMGGGLTPREHVEASQGADGPAEVRHNVHVALATAYDMIRQLEKVNDRRKAVIWVSGGYNLNPFPEARARLDAERFGRGQDSSVDPFLRQGGQFAFADLAGQLAEVTRAANRANATVYALDPRGLPAGPDIDQNVDLREYQDYIVSSQDSLRVLADLTGGVAVVNRNDFTRALKEIDAATSDYYMLGYYSSNPDVTKRRRTIEVKVKRPDLSVHSRTSYTLPPAGR